MSIIASASKDLKFHQWPDGILQQNYTPQGPEGNVQSISWGKDGSWVVLVPESGPTEIISIKENIKLLQTIQDVYRPTCASFHTTTKKLIGIGTMCGQVMIYDIKGKNIKKRFPRAHTKICSLHYNSKDSHIAATCNNGDILLLSNLVGNISAVYKVPNAGSVSSANFHRLKRNLFAAGTDIGIVATWDINSNYMLGTLQVHQAPVSSISFSPLRVDLLVTGGLDRKFTFYDLAAMNPIANVEVNNAVTAVDFSHCGVFLGVGFQNGNIAIYDTRRAFRNPLSVFEAHSGSGIRHLLFQKVLASSGQNNSVFDITIAETPYLDQIDADHLSSNAPACNSVEIVDCDDSNIQEIEVHVTKPSQEYGDSFMLALGLNGSNNLGSNQNEGTREYRVSEDNKKIGDSSKHCTFYQRNSGQRTSLPMSKPVYLKTSSTPKYIDTEVPDAVESPILNTNQTYPLNYQGHNSNTPHISTENLQAMIRDIVRQEVRDIVRNEVQDIVHEEVKSFAESLQSTFKAELTDVLCQVRRHFLDVQMSFIKEFVNMETLIGKHYTVPTDFVCNDLLLNHNVLQQESSVKENMIERDECHVRKF